MTQDEIFQSGEGDQWYERNKVKLVPKDDFVCRMIESIGIQPRRIVEVGCSNGYRLEYLRQKFHAVCYGYDISNEAIEAGCDAFPEIHLKQKALHEIPYDTSFDLVICNFVLHWVDRSLLVQSMSRIDALVRRGGTLVIGDFDPDYQQKRKYHHLPDEEVYTYKQDYTAFFKATGLYRETAVFTFDHDKQTYGYAPSEARGMCAALRKMENEEYYVLTQ